MVRDGPGNVTTCHKVFRNRYKFSRPVRIRRTERKLSHSPCGHDTASCDKTGDDNNACAVRIKRTDDEWLRPPDAVARQRRRARRWHAIGRRLLEGIPEPDQPWLRKRRSRDRDGLGKRPLYRRIVRRRSRNRRNEYFGHRHAREACFRRRRRAIQSPRGDQFGNVSVTGPS